MSSGACRPTRAFTSESGWLIARSARMPRMTESPVSQIPFFTGAAEISVLPARDLIIAARSVRAIPIA